MYILADQTCKFIPNLGKNVKGALFISLRGRCVKYRLSSPQVRNHTKQTCFHAILENVLCLEASFIFVNYFIK